MLEDPKNWNFLLVDHFNYSFLKTYLNQAETIRYKITGNCQKKKIETLLNKIFTTNKQENENEQVECCPRKINLGIFKIVDFGQELSCRFF